MVEVLCQHVSDETTLRELIPSIDILQYTSQVLGVILALLEDPDESVGITAVSRLLMSSPNEAAVEPILLNLSVGCAIFRYMLPSLDWIYIFMMTTLMFARHARSDYEGFLSEI